LGIVSVAPPHYRRRRLRDGATASLFRSRRRKKGFGRRGLYLPGPAEAGCTKSDDQFLAASIS
jgi:hypothetical protein